MYLCNIDVTKNDSSIEIATIEVTSFSIEKLESTIPVFEIAFYQDFKNANYQRLEEIALSNGNYLITNIEIIDTSDNSILYQSHRWNTVGTYYVGMRYSNILPEGKLQFTHIDR